jgi:hypothetical protein
MSAVHEQHAPERTVADQPAVGVHEIRTVLLSEQPDLTLEQVRIPQIVGIQEGNQIRGRVLHAAVAGGTGAQILLAQKRQPVSIWRHRVVDHRTIRRSVVNDDDLRWPHGLGKDGGEALGKVMRAIDGNDHSDAWCGKTLHEISCRRSDARRWPLALLLQGCCERNWPVT